MDYHTLLTMRAKHPAWRLLSADHAPFIVSFLNSTFIRPNLRTLAAADLTSRLDDFLFPLRAELGDEAFPRTAAQYLDDWAANDRGWLRKYYPTSSDEAHFDITPATEKALDWVASLEQRRFVGTESRLMNIIELLRELVTGTETDPWARISELERRKMSIEAEIKRIQEGDLYLLDATRIKERFLHIATTARGLLSDFREVEQGFRDLDRALRERIAAWDGGKSTLLNDIFSERDMIAHSDQGKSFQAFWDFLMSPSRQEDLSALLLKVFELEPVKQLEPDQRLLRIHYDWVQAGEVTQRTISRLSEQLRRYLDDKAWLDDRRIMQLMRGIEQAALALRDRMPEGAVSELDETAPKVDLTMDRPLFNLPLRSLITEMPQDADESVPTAALFNQANVDKPRLAALIRRELQSRNQISLAELVDIHPLEHGLAELVTYLGLAAEDQASVIDDVQRQTLIWHEKHGLPRQATMPLVIFCRPAFAKQVGSHE
jgi:hypothetical protein